MFRSQWITHPSAVYSDSRVYLFRKTFSLNEKPASAELRISAEARYKLFVNGVRAAFGPCRPSGEEKYYDTLDIAQNLKAGENELYCEVLQLPDNADMGKPQTVYGVRRSGNMLLAAELLCGETEVRTDESWETAASPYTRIEGHTWFAGAAMFEESAREGTPEWVPAVKAAPVHAPREKPYPWGIVNPMFVVPRAIPMLYQKDVPFSESRWRATDG